jgi:hypothetical protein
MRYSRQHRRPRLPLPWSHCHPWAWPPSASTIAPAVSSMTSSAGRPKQTAAPSTGLCPRRSRVGGHVATCRRHNANAPYSCQTRTMTFACSCKTGTRERPRLSPPTSACPSGLTATQQFMPFGSCSPKRRRLRQSRFPWQAAASPSSWPGASCSRSKTARDSALTFPG